MTIQVRALRGFTLNDQHIEKGQEFPMPTNQFDDHGPGGTGLVEACSPRAPLQAAAKKTPTSKELPK